MNAYSKKEKLLDAVFVVLMFLSLVCFAGIPALNHSYADASQDYSSSQK